MTEEKALNTVEKAIDKAYDKGKKLSILNLIRSRKNNINNCNSLKRLTTIAYTLC